jgi:phosphoribosylformylglycinamidine cyclo-ligase
MQDLVRGWQKACQESEVKWLGGETPILSGIVSPKAIDLAGAAIGVIKQKSQVILGEKLQAEDAIILFESSGIHANGLSLARKLAKHLQDGYKTKLPNGRMYGEALLDPTIIYSKLIQDILIDDVDIHYMVHITGHGWRKLMRNKKSFTYKITTIPPVPDVLKFIVKETQINEEEAYATFNMGAGFAIFVPQEYVQKVIEIAKANNILAYHAGEVKNGDKQVIIEPNKITFASQTLQVRI